MGTHYRRRGDGTARRLAGLCILSGLCVLVGGEAGAQQGTAAQPPRFRTSVEVTSIDVAVVDGQGKPLLNLAPADFTVRVDGKTRSVVSAEWVPLAAAATETTAPARVPEGYTSNESATGGRLIAIAIDEPHIRPGGAQAVLAAANAFIDRLSPADRIAAVSLGLGSTATPFIADRARVKEAIGRMAGQRDTMKLTAITVTGTEALEISDGNRLTADLVVARECSGLRPGSAQLQQCRQDVESEALTLGDQLKRASQMTTRALRDLLTAMQVLDGPKTLILMSEGFGLTDDGMANELAALAAATRTSIYALKLDNQLFEITNSRAAVYEPLNVRNDGLEALTAAARGALYIVSGTGNQLFANIESELSGYYLLGVQSEPADRDGKGHAIRIDVSRRGATVRTRRQLLNVPADLNKPRNPRDAIAATLTAPLLMSALPLRIATFALRGPEQSKVQLLIRADVGNDYTAARRAWIGYVIQDPTGRVVESPPAVQMAIAPAMNGVPGALQYLGGASLDPGEYTIKFAVAEGDRIGSVEHAVHAVLADLGEVKLSELMVGGPVGSSEIMRPTVGYTVSYGSLHGYVEAYGSHLEQVAAKYEIATTAQGPALMAADVPARAGGPDRILFTQIMPVAKLPPGEYVLRAIVTSSGQPLKTLTRRFEIAPPTVLMTSAAGAAPAPPASAELFLPVEETALIRPFARDDALRPQVVDDFRKRVPTSTKPMFEQGIAELQKANYSAAEINFKRAIRPDVDSTSALVYLAASFAAAGRDGEAAGAWQTALIDGSDVPQIYEWLAESLVRERDYTAARSILEEAVGRWPSDTRFGRTLALSYATLGKGRDAIRVLDRYIADGRRDPDLLFLMVEWLFQVHSSRAVVINRNADLAMARNYAAEYAKADGPKQALVQQWVDFLANEKP
jgi:VWFA-related protein